VCDTFHGSGALSPATKSYTAQLLALYLLFDRVRGGSGGSAAGPSDVGEKLLGEDTHVSELAQRYRFASRLVSTALGYSYPTEVTETL
jgi:glucosamine--fructose-6-phosphate aminotransferase (isomerizing)